MKIFNGKSTLQSRCSLLTDINFNVLISVHMEGNHVIYRHLERNMG